MWFLLFVSLFSLLFLCQDFPSLREVLLPDHLELVQCTPAVRLQLEVGHEDGVAVVRDGQVVRGVHLSRRKKGAESSGHPAVWKGASNFFTSPPFPHWSRICGLSAAVSMVMPLTPGAPFTERSAVPKYTFITNSQNGQLLPCCWSQD